MVIFGLVSPCLLPRKGYSSSPSGVSLRRIRVINGRAVLHVGVAVPADADTVVGVQGLRVFFPSRV